MAAPKFLIWVSRDGRNDYFYAPDGTRYLVDACDREGLTLYNADGRDDEIEVSWQDFEAQYSKTQPEAD